MQESTKPRHEFCVGQRVHGSGDSKRIGTVKYVGPVEGYLDSWVGVDWDNGEGKHDGSINGVRYFHAKSERSGSFVRPQNLNQGISLLEALESRYKSESTKDEEDEMYVLSTSDHRVSVQLLDIKELDLTGNLLSEWKDVGTICEQLPALRTLNLSNNLMSPYKSELPLLKSIHVLVLNNTGVDWDQVELLKQSLTAIEELHVMGNNISRILPGSSSMVQGFDFLQLLNLEDNCIADWNEIMKLSQLKCLEQLYLNKNCLNSLFYPENAGQHESEVMCYKPFQNLRCLLLGNNNIGDLASVDSLNFFPNLVDIRLSANPITDSRGGGVPRFVLIARLAKILTLNGSEVTPRERKDSEIRYVRLVISRLHASPEEIKQHPRFYELKNIYGIEDERPSIGATGPQTISSGLLSITLNCVGASMGEKPPLTKKLPATTTVGKLKFLCESFFKLKSMKLQLFLQEEGSPLPLLLDNDTSSLMDLGIGNDSIILVDEESS
ncbi:tubulin-folding cofactor E isoform X2 [Abrus precatorius]|uniref:Leucine-rich repeat-containing protein 51 n=1 Tax=Abrus precatorius TaxID=3816 RepID=A0A8B8M2Z2_ABRPR|nr:tubulin-folding cofactor E isoform X2 [Abrus precatorius]